MDYKAKFIRLQQSTKAAQEKYKQRNAAKFICEVCVYKTHNKCHFRKHNETKLHIRRVKSKNLLTQADQIASDVL